MKFARNDRNNHKTEETSTVEIESDSQPRLIETSHFSRRGPDIMWCGVRDSETELLVPANSWKMQLRLWCPNKSK